MKLKKIALQVMFSRSCSSQLFISQIASENNDRYYKQKTRNKVDDNFSVIFCQIETLCFKIFTGYEFGSL
jgi:hypothetical protein